MSAFQANVRSHYLRYWALKTDGVFFNGRLQLRAEAFDKWSFRTAAALGLQTGTKPTVQQVLAHAAGTVTASQDFFARTVGANWASLAPFTTFNADWTYTLSPVQLDQVKADLGLDALPLLRQVGVDMAEATRPWDPAIRVGGTVNVTGAASRNR